MSDIEALPLLLEDQDKTEVTEQPYIRLQYAFQRLSTRFLIASHLLVISLTFLASSLLPIDLRSHLVSNCRTTIQKTMPKIAYSPVESAIKNEIITTDSDYWNGDLFWLSQTRESEDAWEAILSPRLIQLPPEIYEPHVQGSSVRIANGNSLFILGYQHNLHCLRRIRQYLQADHYYPGASQAFRKEDYHHTVHCLENIRKSLMCHPDLTLQKFFWSGTLGHNLSVDAGATRSCANWERLREYNEAITYIPPEAESA